MKTKITIKSNVIRVGKKNILVHGSNKNVNNKGRYWWFTVMSPNNKVLATSETYKSRQSAIKGAKSLIKAASMAEIVEE